MAVVLICAALALDFFLWCLCRASIDLPWTRDDGSPLICSICGKAIPRCENGWMGDIDQKVVQHMDCGYQQRIKELERALADSQVGGQTTPKKGLGPLSTGATYSSEVAKCQCGTSTQWRHNGIPTCWECLDKPVSGRDAGGEK